MGDAGATCSARIQPALSAAVAGRRADLRRADHPLAAWRCSLVVLAVGALACAAEPEPAGATAKQAGDPCIDPGGDGATATCTKPKHPPAYYIAQAEAYFDTLDLNADPNSVPAYSELSARWEWPPWLLLTGYGRDNLIASGKLLKKGDPSTVPFRDCRFFAVQPFARCRVRFEYKGGPCPIYEEFVFNDAGEMTFIEAWSDLPALVPTQDPTDLWGERTDIGRLSTRVPGLGKPDGRIDLDSPAMAAAVAQDPEVATFALAARDMWKAFGRTLAGRPEDFFAKGCGWGRSHTGP